MQASCLNPWGRRGVFAMLFFLSAESAPAADLNVYCHSFQRILAPHTAGGVVVRAESYFEEHPESYQQTPVQIGAMGGNVGLLDGSARWKRIEEMRVYRASQAWDMDGAFGYW